MTVGYTVRDRIAYVSFERGDGVGAARFGQSIDCDASGTARYEGRTQRVIKHREWFRPFAPAILAEAQHEYFEHDHPSPYMLHVYKIRPKNERVCARSITLTTRAIATVARDENPLYYDLIQTFGRKTGISSFSTPVLTRMSRSCTPQEAIDCFQRTKMDVLAIGPFLACKGDHKAKA